MRDFKPMSYKELEECEKAWECPPGWEEEVTETAGFVPLEVRMRQMEQNGYVAQFKSSDFTSSDYRDIWLNPDFEILPGDDIEEVARKTALRQEFIKDLMAQKNSANAEEKKETVEDTIQSADKKKTSEEVQ